MKTEVSAAVAEAMEAIRKRKETEEANSRALDERIKNANILIAVPAYGGAIQAACVNTLIGLERFLAERGIEHEFRFITNEALITRARNFLANAAAFGTSTSGKEFSNLLFVDADIACDPADVWKMLQADVPIIGLPCARKQIVWQTVAEAARRNIPAEQLPKFAGNPCFNVSGSFDVNSIAEVRDIGTGCMLIRTEVFRTLASLHPEWKYQLLPTEQKLGRDWNYDFFKVGICPTTKVYLRCAGIIRRGGVDERAIR